MIDIRFTVSPRDPVNRSLAVLDNTIKYFAHPFRGGYIFGWVNIAIFREKCHIITAKIIIFLVGYNLHVLTCSDRLKEFQKQVDTRNDGLKMPYNVIRPDMTPLTVQT